MTCKGVSLKLEFCFILLFEIYSFTNSLGMKSIPYVLNVEIFPIRCLGLGVRIRME